MNTRSPVSAAADVSRAGEPKGSPTRVGPQATRASAEASQSRRIIVRPSVRGRNRGTVAHDAPQGAGLRVRAGTPLRHGHHPKIDDIERVTARIEAYRDRPLQPAASRVGG